MSQMTTPSSVVNEAAVALDGHVREIIAWHFSEETGTPRWIEWARTRGVDPISAVQGFDDLLRTFDEFDGDVLRTEPHEAWIPRAYAGRPFTIFETGGTTGMPKQRMIGPTGPRRLRLAVEHLANHRGCSCYFIDLDPRWVKQLIRNGQPDQANRYMDHVIDQAKQILKHRDVSVLFATPRLLEALSERVSIPGAGVKGVFCGGTTMSPQYVRFLIEEVLEGQTQLVPTYGNTLMGLAAHKPLTPEDNYSITYYAPQPRAVLRVVDPADPLNVVEHGAWGRVELTTMTREFFMPRFLER
ncbi:MAG: hypothetical protein ACYTF9_12220, partial [Planctomycetota bacterium]